MPPCCEISFFTIGTVPMPKPDVLKRHRALGLSQPIISSRPCISSAWTVAKNGICRAVIEGLASDGRDYSRGYHPAHTLADTILVRLGFVSDAERAVLAQVPMTPRTLAPGDELVRQGSSPDHLYFLSAGWAYRSITIRSGERQIPTLLVPGSVCNLDNLLLDRADFGVCAVTNATVLMLPRKRALALATENAGVGRAFTWLAIAENAILSQWTVGLGRRSALGRLAHLLCEMSSRVAAGDPDKGTFELPLTQELIADAIGLTPVHVNRTMQHLRTEGLIATSGRTITILDFDRLRAVAEFDDGYLRQIDESAVSSLAGSA
jgi:CRP-like cAMP-binding protein